MALWFDRSEQKRKMLSYLPTGRAYKKAWVEGSAFNNLIAWLGRAFERLIDFFNLHFKGLFIRESDYLLDEWMIEYKIPNDVFYYSKEENQIDVFVLRHLMQGNTRWHFQAVANVYGLDVCIENGINYFSKYRFPISFPYRFYEDVGDFSEVMVVIFKVYEAKNFPLPFPYRFGDGRKIEKVKKIFSIMKEAQARILYLPPPSELEVVDQTTRFPIGFPLEFGVREGIEEKFIGVEYPERITFFEE